MFFEKVQPVLQLFVSCTSNSRKLSRNLQKLNKENCDTTNKYQQDLQQRAPLHVLKVSISIEQGNLFLSWEHPGLAINFTQHIRNPRQLRYRRYYLNNGLIKNPAKPKLPNTGTNDRFIFQSFNLISFKDAVECSTSFILPGISAKTKCACLGISRPSGF